MTPNHQLHRTRRASGLRPLARAGELGRWAQRGQSFSFSHDGGLPMGTVVRVRESRNLQFEQVYLPDQGPLSTEFPVREGSYRRTTYSGHRSDQSTELTLSAVALHTEEGPGSVDSSPSEPLKSETYAMVWIPTRQEWVGVHSWAQEWLEDLAHGYTGDRGISAGRLNQRHAAFILNAYGRPITAMPLQQVPRTEASDLETLDNARSADAK